MQDSIEREILIEAPLDLVWDLVIELGWWVPDERGVVGDRSPGATTVRSSEQHGQIPVQVVQLSPQTYAAFRWTSTVAPAALTGTHTTLVDFHLEPADAGVRVRVVESSFSAREVPVELAQQCVTDNNGGWEMELGHLREMVAQPASA